MLPTHAPLTKSFPYQVFFFDGEYLDGGVAVLLEVAEVGPSGHPSLSAKSGEMQATTVSPARSCSKAWVVLPWRRWL